MSSLVKLHAPSASLVKDSRFSGATCDKRDHPQQGDETAKAALDFGGWCGR